MKIRLPRAVIFDWDNTLVDSWGAIMEAINVTRAHFGKQVWTLEEIHRNCTLAAREIFPEWFGDQWETAYNLFYRTFDEVRQKQGIQPVRGANDLLRWLKAREIPSFVVSNKRSDYLRQESSALKWDDLFVAVIGSTDAPRDKPARDPVDLALKQGNLTADPSIWFVGDSSADILCARNADCTPVVIANRGEAEKHKVELVFEDCLALQEHLSGL